MKIPTIFEHKVLLPRDRATMLHDAVVWCETNFGREGHSWQWWSGVNDPELYTADFCWVFRFSQATDATLFGLRWL